MTEQKEIFFHVGLGKTGTTYLQYRFFPQLENIHYVQYSNYRNAEYARIIHEGNESKYLVSTGFDRQLEQELHNIAGRFPHARIIMVFRRQDKWAASQYRRKVKNGYPGSFSDFIDLENDHGDWKQQNLFYYPKIQLAEQLFEHKPLVLFHDDLVKDPYRFFDYLAWYMNATYKRENVDLRVKHTAWSDKQLKFMLHRINQTLPGKDTIKLSKNYLLRKAQIHSIMAPRYLMMAGARLSPDAWLPDTPLVSEEEMEQVRSFYADDWEECLKYARENNPAEKISDG